MAASVYTEISKCVPGPGVNLDLGMPSLYSGCQCLGQCEFGTESIRCSCTCAYNEDGLLFASYMEQISAPVIECNSSCTCKSNCPNRRSQTDPGQDLAVIATKSKGLGVVSSTDLRQGSFVGEYAGEVVSSLVADERLKSHSSTAKCYIIRYREHLSNDTVMTTNIDATYKGNVTRFINHSCDPNLVMLPIRSDSIVPRLCLFTCKHVSAGNELCFSYFGSTASVVSKSIPIGSKRCFCGSVSCIGYLPLERL